jgi:transcriptional regulator with XRE-family HTH domain
MPRKKDPSKERDTVGLALQILRGKAGLTQKDVERLSGIGWRTLSDYERGVVQKLDLEGLRRLAKVMGYETADADAVVFLLGLMPPSPSERREKNQTTLLLTPSQERAIGQTAAVFGRVAGALSHRHLVRMARMGRARRDREIARTQWQDLKSSRFRDLRLLVKVSAEFRTWSFCELLCERSERAAGDKPAAAIDLGRLAVEIAQQVEGDQRSTSRLEGFARVHLANAQRAASDLNGAAREMEQGLRLWRIGEGSVLGGVLDESRVLDLEASLRRAQRQFGKALDLIEKAMELVGPGGRGRLLLKKWKIFEQMGRVDEMLAVVEEARHEIDEQNPRLLFAQRFNHAVTLQLLGRMSEAGSLLAEARGLAIANDRHIELVRVTWQEGRVAESLGQRQKAVELTTQARNGFLEADNAYDAALTSLDLAILYLSDGRKHEVRILAREMLPIFQSLGAQPEAAAAVLVFIKAVEDDRISLKQVRGIIDVLERVRNNPELRLKP